MRAADPQLLDDIMIRVINKNSGKMMEIERKQDNMYDAVTTMEKTVNILFERINKLEKELMLMQKSAQVIKEAEFL